MLSCRKVLPWWQSLGCLYDAGAQGMCVMHMRLSLNFEEKPVYLLVPWRFPPMEENMKEWPS